MDPMRPQHVQSHETKDISIEMSQNKNNPYEEVADEDKTQHPNHISGWPLALVTTAVTFGCALMMLDASILATVRRQRSNLTSYP